MAPLARSWVAPIGRSVTRAAGVSFEDRQDLLGHKSRRITDHYSAAELSQLIEAANQVCGEKSRKSPALVLVKSAARKKVAVSS